MVSTIIRTRLVFGKMAHSISASSHCRDLIKVIFSEALSRSQRLAGARRMTLSASRERRKRKLRWTTSKS